jgi:competence protein ComEC
LLLTGDVQLDAEAQLLERERAMAAEVVVVPHHGSRTSSGAGLIMATRPRWALVSAGYRNRWGFPASSVVDRWSSVGADLVSTSTAGAVEFDLRPDRTASAPQEWRLAHRRLWRDP